MTELTRPSSRDWLLPAAVALAMLWRAVFPLYQLICLALGEGGPALGITAVTAAIWAAVLLFLGKSARWNAYSIFLAAGALLLALFCAVYGDASVRAVNCVLILCASARVQRNSHSLETMEISAIRNAGISGRCSVPPRRVAIASPVSPIATTTSARPMNADTRVSMRPCPYG